MRDFSNIAVKIARLADRQFGHVTRQQLLDLGVPSATIAYWVTNARLITVHAGVYAVGHRQHTAVAKAMAAVLACGAHAVLSHDSAAALWGVRTWPARPEVSVATEKRRRGIRTHRTETLISKDVRRQLNIRVTSPSRTILDIQTRLTDKQLVRAVNELRLEGHLKATELQRLLNNSKRVKDPIDPQQNPSRSPMEDEFLAFCDEYGLPSPKVNVMLFGHEVDALFERERVIVELDSWTHHKEHDRFEAERDAVAAEHCYVTVRVTHIRLTQNPRTEAERLHRTLARRRGPRRDAA